MKNPFQTLAFFAACGVIGFVLREWFGFTTADLAIVGLIAIYAKHAYDVEELKIEIESLRRKAAEPTLSAPDPSHLETRQPFRGHPAQ